MAHLIYSAICSLDEYIEDETGHFDWAAPDEEVHRFVNELERAIGTYLYGRRMYEVMRFWETDRGGAQQAAYLEDYANLWRAADKIVYSRTLDRVASTRTRLEREFNPERVRRMKASAERDLSVGGPGLAAEAFKAGLVDEVQLFLHPVLVGGGKPALPKAVQLTLEPVEQRRFGSGVVYLHYRTRS
jgi:dihydrofolate reductase